MLRAMKRYALSMIASVIVGIYLFPIYWMYATSFKGPMEAMFYPPTLWPRDLVSNHWDVFNGRDMPRYFWNSIVITTGTLAITVTVGTGSAYALSLKRNLWVEVALFSILLMQALPPSLMVTPLFVMFNYAGLLDTPRLAVILALAGKSLPFYIVICRSAFLGIPKDLREAALVDGSSNVGVFLWIVIPLARNAILVAATLLGIQAMGDYVYSASFIYDQKLQPLTLGLANYVGVSKTDWAGIMTYSSIMVTPILLTFMLLQRRLVRGLTAGALK
jgi:multiple sugar transport system permease protein